MTKPRFVGIIQIEQSAVEPWGLEDRWNPTPVRIADADLDGLQAELDEEYVQLVNWMLDAVEDTPSS